MVNHLHEGPPPHLRKGLDGTVSVWFLAPFFLIFSAIAFILDVLADWIDRRNARG